MVKKRCENQKTMTMLWFFSVDLKCLEMYKQRNKNPMMKMNNKQQRNEKMCALQFIDLGIMFKTFTLYCITAH